MPISDCWLTGGGKHHFRTAPKKHLHVLHFLNRQNQLEIICRYLLLYRVASQQCLADLGEARGCSTNTFVIY